MTTTETGTAGQPGSQQAAARPPSTSVLRRSAAIRVAIAVFLAAALTASAIVARWAPLSGKSEVMGYPIFSDFNPNNYADAYYLAVGLFPIAALLIFFGLTRIGPRVGLAVPPSRGRLRPLVSPAEAEPSRNPEPSLRVNLRVAAAARVALVGAVLGLEVGVASNHLWASVVVSVVGYSLLVVVGSIALGRFTSSRSTLVRLATVNSLGTPLTVGALSLVSAHTSVRVLSNNSVQHYSWFPVWLGTPLAAALFAWILVSLRRAGPARAAVIERRTVLLIAAPVALFVLVARLPGDLGPISLYEQGQFVTETMLVFQHGWLPWRDVVVVHGLLGDVIPTAIGWGVFGDSYWGDSAGLALICIPLAIVSTYLLLAYLVGRSWPVLLIAASIFLGTWLGSVDFRFVLWPMVLLLLAALLRRFTRVRAAALGFLTVFQAILTPEMAAAVPIVAVVLGAYELYWRPTGASVARAFRGTVWFLIAAAASAGAFSIYMASRGALGDVISVTLDLLAGHYGLGIPPTTGGAPQAEYDFIALAPIAALLVSFAYAAARLRLRRPFQLADWPMAAVALYVLFYYTKFLTRMDFAHAYQPFMIATPLIIYIIYRAVTAAELWIRLRVPKRHAGWLTAHPVGIAVLICFLVLFWGPLRTTVETRPAAYRATAPDPPVPHVGYAALFESATVDDLQQIVNAYLGPHGRLMDITDEPGLFYYLLGREPSSRWFAPGGALVSTVTLQRLLIGDLRRARPKLIVFDDLGDLNMYGLPSLDGMPNNVFFYLVSRWILAHYRPLLVSHGRTIYALPGVPPVSNLHLHLHQQPVTTGVQFLVQRCNWGDSPSFLKTPAEPPSNARTVSARSTIVRPAQVTFTGWAGDMRTGEPAREVIATFNGRIVGRSTPDLKRPDVPAAGFPAGFLRSGFQLSIPTWANAAGALRVLAFGRDGSVAELGMLTTPARDAVARIGDRTVVLQAKAVAGHVDAEAASGPLVQIEPPAGSTWADYRWLEVDAPSFGGFLQGEFDLSDQPNAMDPGHVISFDTLASSPRRYVIPVSSCAQWRGYGSSRLFMVSTPPQEIGAVRLIR
jgi:hypothetical protein